MLKKNATIIAAIMTASLSSAYAADGQINFTGTITDAACTIVNSMSNPLAVNLGTVSSKAFNGAGSTAAPTKFTITLKDCPATVKSAKVKFDGASDTNDTSILKLTQVSGAATGVGIQLSDNTNTVVPLYTESAAYPLTTGDNNLDFVARYKATAQTVTSGPANSTSDFTIVYN